MKLVLVGHGSMGAAIAELAAAKGIAVIDRLTRERPLCVDEQMRRAFAGAVLMDFSVPGAVVGNVRTAAELGLDMVIGTTGWHDQREHVRAIVERSTIGVVYSSNFSIGVNVFYRVVELAAQLLSAVDGYDPFILDWHHRFKIDSPSGTALEIRRRVARHYGERQVPIASQRAGYIPSAHSVGFDSEVDTIHLEHRARSRRGLADGALLAARWIAGRPGLHEFGEVLDSRPDAADRTVIGLTNIAAQA
jgi:4-hydroxy-tetrahydrodipicolinate reductase